MPEARNKLGWLRVRISSKDEATIKRAARTDGRSVTNWIERYVVPLAKKQTKGKR